MQDALFTICARQMCSYLKLLCCKQNMSKLEREAVPNDDILQYPFGEGWLDQHTPGLIVIAVFELCL